MKQNQQYEYIKAMKCVAREECKCRGPLVAGETEFFKVALNVCSGIICTFLPPPITYKLLINSFAMSRIFQITVRFRGHYRIVGIRSLLYLTLLTPRIWSGC